MKIGVLGGGQLARMMAAPAKALGIELCCVDSAPDACAKSVVHVSHTRLDNLPEIERHFQSADCVTLETENLPLDAVTPIASKFKLLPSLEALRLTQDRLLEKNFLNSLAIATAPFLQVDTWEDVQAASDQLSFPFMLKMRRSGYDGKGQRLVKTAAQMQAAWDDLSDHALIAEGFVDFDSEVSIVAVRDQQGNIAYYPLILNQHHDGILRFSHVPYQNDTLYTQAKAYADKLLSKLDYVGVLTIEFFCVGDRLIANEIAPRVHNSGHWTIEGAETSQFENHLRAIAGLPLGSTEAKCYSAMINMIGERIPQEKIAAIDQAYYHWYEKEPRPKRKLGHITVCADSPQELHNSLKKVFNDITIP